MRVLISSSSSFWLSREAVLRARELGALWALPDEMPLLGEEEHHQFGPDWRDFVHGGSSEARPWHGDEEEFLRWEDCQYSLPDEVPRHDPILLRVFDEMGGEAMEGSMRERPDDVPSEYRDRIECVEVPDDVTYFIGSYLAEWVAEQHRVWSTDDPTEGRPAGWTSFTKSSAYQPRRKESSDG
jgi:hypothetical protein